MRVRACDVDYAADAHTHTHAHAHAHAHAREQHGCGEQKAVRGTGGEIARKGVSPAHNSDDKKPPDTTQTHAQTPTRTRIYTCEKRKG